jgi:AmiR/NasT family two-component response regulator
MIIDSYFKYEPFYLNFDKGFITIRRPISINKFLEVLKIALYGSIKKKKTLDYEKIRALEFAKTILVVYEKMFEEEAHKYVEMMAMNQRVSLYDACIDLIVKYLLEKENIAYEHKNKF